MITFGQNSEFTKHILPGSLLEDAIEWIRTNLNPDDVFEEDRLLEAVQAAYSPDDVFTKDELLKTIQTANSPGDVFTESELISWAEDNGFSR